MSGLNRTQDQLISSVNLRTALQGFSLVPSQILEKQNQLLAELVAKNRKAPSIFKAGSGYEFRNQYLLPQDGDNATASYLAWGVLLVKILDIQDADIVRISSIAINNNQGGTPSQIDPPVLFFALSPNDTLNTIPSSQFTALNKGQANIQGQGGTNLMTVSAEIPCAGNKYLHLFGFDTFENDFWTQWNSLSLPPFSSQSPQYSLTYALIK